LYESPTEVDIEADDEVGLSSCSFFLFFNVGGGMYLVLGGMNQNMNYIHEKNLPNHDSMVPSKIHQHFQQKCGCVNIWF